jgi:osmoprotectant transport system permease protein
VNVLVAMSIYTVALLVRTVADGLGAVPDHVIQAATAMGYRRVKRFFSVELPLAVPVIAAGLRVAAVSNVSIVSVAAIIGIAQLGTLFTDGFNRNFYDPIVIGVIGSVLLALLFDAVIVVLTRLITPWDRAQRVRS